MGQQQGICCCSCRLCTTYLENVPRTSAQVICAVSRVFNRQHVHALGLLLLSINLVVKGAAATAADAHFFHVEGAAHQAEEVDQQHTKTVF